MTMHAVLSATVCALLFVGCDAGPSARQVTSGNAEFGRPIQMDGGNTSDRGRQMEFLNRIRQADPQYQTIERAFLNERNELGLILDRTVEMDKIPALMRGMLTQMAREFPGQDLTVIAYTPSNPPRTIGTAHLNARTRDMTYTPAG